MKAHSLLKLVGPGIGDPDTQAKPATDNSSFWRFTGAVLAGNTVGASTAWVARKMAADAHPETRAIATALGGVFGFWLGAGITWAATRKP